MKKRLWIGLIITLSIVIVAIVAIVLKDSIGVSKGKIESNAREFHNIPIEWNVSQSTTDTVSAMIFYPDDCSDYCYSIYVKHRAMPLGYSFRTGGSISEIENGICEFNIEGYNETIYLSLNTSTISKMLVDDGDTVESIEIDKTKPFVHIVPSNAGNVSFIDDNSDEISVTHRDIQN